MDEIPNALIKPLTYRLLRIADDKLILGQRNSDWTGLAPILEEDIAFSSIAQDSLCHAEAIYQFLSPLINKSVDELAFGRIPEDYRCCSMTQLSENTNWGLALIRLHLCSKAHSLMLKRFENSIFLPLAELTNKIRKEESCCLDHTTPWISRLNNGTEESREQLHKSIDKLQPHTNGLLIDTLDQHLLTKNELYKEKNLSLTEEWFNEIKKDFKNTCINWKEIFNKKQYTQNIMPDFITLHKEMTHIWTSEPGAKW